MFLARDFLINPSDILTQLYSSGQKTAGFSHPEIKGATIITKPFSNVHAEWGMTETLSNNKKLTSTEKSVAWWLASHKTTGMVPVGNLVCIWWWFASLKTAPIVPSVGITLYSVVDDLHPIKLLQWLKWVSPCIQLLVPTVLPYRFQGWLFPDKIMVTPMYLLLWLRCDVVIVVFVTHSRT